MENNHNPEEQNRVRPGYDPNQSTERNMSRKQEAELGSFLFPAWENKHGGRHGTRRKTLCWTWMFWSGSDSNKPNRMNWTWSDWIHWEQDGFWRTSTVQQNQLWSCKHLEEQQMIQMFISGGTNQEQLDPNRNRFLVPGNPNIRSVGEEMFCFSFSSEPQLLLDPSSSRGAEPVGSVREVLLLAVLVLVQQFLTWGGRWGRPWLKYTDSDPSKTC